MSLENLTHVLVSDYKVDLGSLRRAYLAKKIYVDGRRLVNSCDTFSYPVIKVDTGYAHTIKVNGKVIRISKRTDWRFDSGDSF